MNTKERLREITNDFMNEYAGYCVQSRNEYLKTLKPGTPTPSEGKIYGDAFLRSFNERADFYRSKVDALLGGKLDEIAKVKTTAPSSDVVNLLTMLSFRDNINENDIDEVMQAHGDNYQAYRALQDIAKKHNVRIYQDHPLVSQEEVLKSAKKALDSFMTYDGVSARGNSFAEFLLAELPEDM